MSAEAIAADPLLVRRSLTRVQFEALVEAGLLAGEPVELLEGVLVEMAPQGEEDAYAVSELTNTLVRAVPPAWRVRVQLPLAATSRSEPEPDLAVVAATGRQHPRTAVLVIEVASSSQRTDLVHKPGIYAAAGVEQYWVIDVVSRDVVVHTDPRGGPGAAGYASITRQPWTVPLTVLGLSIDLDGILGERAGSA